MSRDVPLVEMVVVNRIDEEMAFAPVPTGGGGRRRKNPLRPFDLTPPSVIEAAKRMFLRLRREPAREPAGNI